MLVIQVPGIGRIPAGHALGMLPDRCALTGRRERMYRVLSGMVAGILVLSIAACGGEQPAAPLTVGVMVPSPTATAAVSFQAPTMATTAVPMPTTTGWAATATVSGFVTEPAPGATAPDLLAEYTVVVPTAAAGRTAAFAIVSVETSARYEIEEIILENNLLATVVGETNHVGGELTLNYDDPAASQFGLFTANLGALTSDQPERDEAIRVQWLESIHYPVATFVVEEVRGFPSHARAGEPVQFQLFGDLTIKETTREVVWDVTATLNVERLTGTAVTTIGLSDIGVSPPVVAGVLAVTDSVTIAVDFTFDRIESIPIPSSC